MEVSIITCYLILSAFVSCRLEYRFIVHALLLGRALDTADNLINISGTRYMNQSCLSGICNFRTTSREWFCFESEMTIKVKCPCQWTVPKCAYALTLLLYWIIQGFWIVVIVFKCINVGNKRWECWWEPLLCNKNREAWDLRVGKWMYSKYPVFAESSIISDFLFKIKICCCQRYTVTNFSIAEEVTQLVLLRTLLGVFTKWVKLTHEVQLFRLLN